MWVFVELWPNEVCDKKVTSLKFYCLISISLYQYLVDQCYEILLIQFGSYIYCYSLLLSNLLLSLVSFCLCISSFTRLWPCEYIYYLFILFVFLHPLISW